MYMYIVRKVEGQQVCVVLCYINLPDIYTCMCIWYTVDIVLRSCALLLDGLFMYSVCFDRPLHVLPCGHVNSRKFLFC